MEKLGISLLILSFLLFIFLLNKDIYTRFKKHREKSKENK